MDGLLRTGTANLRCEKVKWELKMRSKLTWLFLIAVCLNLVACTTADPIQPSAVRVRKNVKNLTAQEKADFVRNTRIIISIWLIFVVSLNKGEILIFQI